MAILASVAIATRDPDNAQEVRLSAGDGRQGDTESPTDFVVPSPDLPVAPEATLPIPALPRVPRLPAVTVPRSVSTLVPALPTCDAGRASAFPDKSTYAVSTSGGPFTRVLSPNAAGIVSPHISFNPDGARMAFTRYNRADGTRVLMTARPDGTDEAPLAVGVVNPGGVAWSPDGAHLAYLADPAQPAAQSRSIVVQRLSDGEERRIWTGEGVSFLYWSPQGDRLAWGSVRDADQGVWTADVAGGAARRLLDDAAYSEVSWSRDGRLLATGGTGPVRLVRSDTGEIVRTLSIWGRPRWSPVDPDTLVVSNGTVYTVNTLTGIPRPLGPGHIDRWLPDGAGYIGDDNTNLGVYRFERACFTAVAKGWGLSAGFDGLTPDGRTALVRTRPTF